MNGGNTHVRPAHLAETSWKSREVKGSWGKETQEKNRKVPFPKVEGSTRSGNYGEPI